MGKKNEKLGVFDKILDIVEIAFLRLASEKNLVRRTLERWRWDEPIVTLSWIGEDGVSRNIHALIQEGSSPYELEVEGNAWWDEDRGPNKGRVRLWCPKKFGTLEVPEDPRRLEELLRETLSKGYPELFGLKEADFVEEPLSSQAEASPP